MNDNWDKIDKAVGEKVDKSSGAEENKIDVIKKNGEVLEIANKTVNIELNKTDVGLSEVDNTSDMDKPISTAVNNALDKKLNKENKATQAEAEEGTNDEKYMTPQSSKQAIDKALEGYTPSGGGGVSGDTLPIRSGNRL